MERKRYQIFISSTYKDLIEERQKVTQAILKLYHFPIGMEMFHADNEEQWVQIKNTIDMSDFYVLIVGRYCGTLIEDEGISYTEKEYNYALSKGIPVLSFVISDNAKKESYGVETSKQQKALKKFLKKVKKLPCEFWSTADELAFQVSSALSIKFQEETRNGWIPYNPYGVPFEKVEDLFVGCYDLLYYSEIKARSKRIIKSKLVIEATGVATFYNNLKDDNVNAEYIYRGSCHITENIVYIFLNNSVSKERAVFYLIRSVGKLDRLIGLLIALSSNMIPVCIKVACFKEELFNKGINEDLLSDIITSCNTVWENNMLTIEESQKHLFFSDEMLL